MTGKYVQTIEAMIAQAGGSKRASRRGVIIGKWGTRGQTMVPEGQHVRVDDEQRLDVSVVQTFHVRLRVAFFVPACRRRLASGGYKLWQNIRFAGSARGRSAPVFQNARQCTLNGTNGRLEQLG